MNKTEKFIEEVQSLIDELEGMIQTAEDIETGKEFDDLLEELNVQSGTIGSIINIFDQ